MKKTASVEKTISIVKMEKLPTVSVVIPTYNSQRTIEQCLSSIGIQKYPRKKIEIILVDGGSSDNTIKLAEKHNIKLINVPSTVQTGEYNKGVGVNAAKGEIILLLDSDNVIPHRYWLKKMVIPFLENKDVIGVETLRYHYNPKASLFDRYYSLYGSGEPLLFYTGKSDRLSYIYDTYNLMGSSRDCGDYYLVTFDQNEVPAIGANGFLIRRKILIENARVKPNFFFHTDVNVDLIKKGFNTYAFVKETIIHLAGQRSITNYVYRRMLFMDQYHMQQYAKRRYSVIFGKRDIVRLLKYSIYSVTFIKPTIDAIKGYRRVKDKAWFLNPILSFTLFLAYSYTYLKREISR